MRYTNISKRVNDKVFFSKMMYDVSVWFDNVVLFVQEGNLGENFQDLATEMAPLYKQLAPKAYSNQVSPPIMSHSRLWQQMCIVCKYATIT